MTTTAPTRERVRLDNPNLRCPDGGPKAVAAAKARHRELIADFQAAITGHADALSAVNRIEQDRIADHRQAALDGTDVPDRSAEEAEVRHAEEQAYVRLVGLRDAVLTHKEQFGAMIAAHRESWSTSNRKLIAKQTDTLLRQLADLRVTLADLQAAHKVGLYLDADPEYATNGGMPLVSSLGNGKVEVKAGYAPESIDAILSAIEQSYAGGAR